MMRSFVNNKSKVYNTNTAEEIGEWWNGQKNEEATYRAATLYGDDEGRLFIRHSNNIYHPRLKQVTVFHLQPISYKQAFEWVLQHDQENLILESLIDYLGDQQ